MVELEAEERKGKKGVVLMTLKLHVSSVETNKLRRSRKSVTCTSLSLPSFFPSLPPPSRSLLTGEEGVGALQYLLVSNSGQLQVFQDSSLMWAATLPHPPADITVATFQSVAPQQTLCSKSNDAYMLKIVTKVGYRTAS